MFIYTLWRVLNNLDCCRLEVQADVASSQRFSLSSETTSATTSLSEKSLADDGGASTRALAGSVLNYKVTSSQTTVLRLSRIINYKMIVCFLWLCLISQLKTFCPHWYWLNDIRGKIHTIWWGTLSFQILLLLIFLISFTTK